MKFRLSQSHPRKQPEGFEDRGFHAGLTSRFHVDVHDGINHCDWARKWEKPDIGV